MATATGTGIPWVAKMQPVPVPGPPVPAYPAGFANPLLIPTVKGIVGPRQDEALHYAAGHCSTVIQCIIFQSTANDGVSFLSIRFTFFELCLVSF